MGTRMENVEQRWASPAIRRYTILSPHQTYVWHTIQEPGLSTSTAADRPFMASHACKATPVSRGRQMRVWCKEAVVHVLADCPRLVALRQKLRKEVGEAFIVRRPY
jgi:hypothetical protein